MAKTHKEKGTVKYLCNPSTLGGWGRKILSLKLS